MTEFHGLSSGNRIVIENNIDNIMVGNDIVVCDEVISNKKIVGTVENIKHRIFKWDKQDAQHDIIIYISDDE